MTTKREQRAILRNWLSEPPKTLAEWRARHAECGKPTWLDVTIGEWEHHRCRCGDVYKHGAKKR